MSNSMNAIDVIYQTEVSIENKSTEQLTLEINTFYHQAEQLAGMSAAMLAESGRRLIEQKSRIPYGEFTDWCENNLDFSYRKASRMMQLAEKMDDENSLFSKMPTLATLGISRIWELLAAPEEVAEEVIQNTDVESLTVRELKAEIKRLKDEKKEAEARNEQTALEAESESEQKIADLEYNIDHLRHELSAAQGELAAALTEEDAEKMRREYEDQVREAHESEARKEAERLDVVAKLDKAKEDLKKQKAKQKELEAAKDEEIQKRLEEASTELSNKAKEEAFAESEAELKKSAESIKALKDQVKKLEAEKAKLSINDLMEFKILCDQLQDIYGKINAVIDRQEDELAQKMRQALFQITSGWTI